MAILKWFLAVLGLAAYWFFLMVLTGSYNLGPWAPSLIWVVTVGAWALEWWQTRRWRSAINYLWQLAARLGLDDAALAQVLGCGRLDVVAAKSDKRVAALSPRRVRRAIATLESRLGGKPL
ncbi:hypothetical protein [Lacticaseibacillus parakribbianus]|uniref:hypothetical protein n=1 Tax=Lacticaseibacillus parakribbianus TaxID=2970927 RepID=UPI0021CB2EB5|nr:hypothetical protein [Lacticaseibacillus parakribbianus]